MILFLFIIDWVKDEFWFSTGWLDFVFGECGFGFFSGLGYRFCVFVNLGVVGSM